MSTINPENEKLRSEIPEPPDAKTVLDEILHKTKYIHVAFLYAGIGNKLLQELALSLCSTKNSLVYSGWKELSIQLGLDSRVPNCVENCNIMKQDYVFTMLVPYTQQEDATVGKVYQGLYDIDRCDVIFRTQEYVHEFYLEMCKLTDVDNLIKVFKPARIPEAPFIFQNLKRIDKKAKHKPEKIDEIQCQAEVVTRSKNKNKKECNKIVMLTYRSQDYIAAQKIAAEFRKERNGQQIGVILLEEHANKVMTERENLIIKFFARADYILPIISTDYLQCITEKEMYNSATGNLDSAYVKYIYDLMTNDYITDGCKNKKIRCIIPDEQFSKVCKHYIFKSPMFRTWVQMSDIDDLASKILSNKI